MAFNNIILFVIDGMDTVNEFLCKLPLRHQEKAEPMRKQ